ncbi:MAG: HPr family phosphocarrier protein [Pseudomonadota bacterium]
MDSAISPSEHTISGEEGAYAARVTICNQKGLHARASAQFVKCAATFNCNVYVSRGGETVGGTSIMGLMMLAAAKGCEISIKSDGPQAKEALDALVQLVEARFHEEA